jgi:hypothetical protein
LAKVPQEQRSILVRQREQRAPDHGAPGGWVRKDRKLGNDLRKHHAVAAREGLVQTDRAAQRILAPADCDRRLKGRDLRSRANAALSPTRAWTVVRLIGILVLALDEVLEPGFAALSSLGFERERRAR